MERRERGRRNIFALGAVSFLTDLSTEMVYPILPLYLTTRLGAGPAVLGVIEGLAESLSGLLRVASGWISDRLGRRKPLAILGYACSSGGKVLLYLSRSWHWVLAGRVVDRFGKGVRTAPRDALIAEGATPGTRGGAFGLHRAMDTGGAVAGVVVAYLALGRWGLSYPTIFLWSLVPAFLAVVVLHGVSEAKPAREGRPRHGRREPLSLRLKLFLLVVFLFALGNSSNQFLLLRARAGGVADTSVILLYLVYNVVYAALSYPAGRISDLLGRKTMLVLGYAAYGLIYLGFAVTRGVAGFWPLFAGYGLYMAMTEGVEKALVVDLAPAEMRATVIGLHSTLVGIGLLPASVVAGLLWRYLGMTAPFFFGGALGLAAALGILLLT